MPAQLALIMLCAKMRFTSVQNTKMAIGLLKSVQMDLDSAELVLKGISRFHLADSVIGHQGAIITLTINSFTWQNISLHSKIYVIFAKEHLLISENFRFIAKKFSN